MVATRSAVAGNGGSLQIYEAFASVRLQTELMKITPSMIQAARRAEFDYYQKARALGPDRFMPTPDPVIRAMLEAAVKQFDLPAVARTNSIIVEAASTKRRR